MATVPVKLRRWGNSLAAIIPASVARKEGLKEGDEIVVEIDKRALLRAAFGSMPELRIHPQKMKDEDRDAW